MQFLESTAEFFIFTLAFGVGVLVLVAVAHWNRRKSREGTVIRQLRATETTPIADVADESQVKIVGKVRVVDEPLRAPLSGRSCAYFALRVEERRPKRRSVDIIEDHGGGHLLLEDETGKAYVMLDDPSLALEEELQFSSGLSEGPSAEAVEILERYGQEPKTSLGVHKQLGYYETIVQEGDTLTVYGQAKWESDPDPEAAGEDYRDRPKRLSITAPPYGSLLVSDEPSART